MRNDRPGPSCESLEQRVVLSASAMPGLEELSDPTNPVVRIETSAGDIDLEVLQSEAPGAAHAMLELIQSGRLDDSLFTPNADDVAFGAHRLGDAVTGDASSLPENDSTLAIEQRTVTLADGGSGSIALRIALDDARAEEAGAVARVVNDASWQTVLSIAGLDTATLDGSGEFFASPNADLTDGVQRSDAVLVIDASVSKNQGALGLMEHTIYYPEGFADFKTNEFVSLVNPTGETVEFQVLARAEFGERDTIVAEGSLAPGATDLIALNIGEVRGSNLVPRFTPYALEVVSTGVLGASLRHSDFGTDTGESFTNLVANEWLFPEVIKDSGSVHDFLVFQNTSGEDAEVRISALREGVEVLLDTMTVEAHRRSGIAVERAVELSESLIADGDTSFPILISSDQPIVAALSHYETAGDGFTTLGIPTADGDLPPAFGPALFAVEASADVIADHRLVMVNTNNDDANVRFRLSLAGEVSEIQTASIVVPGAASADTAGVRDFALTELLDLVSEEQRTLLESGATFSLTTISDIPLFTQSIRRDNGDVTSDALSSAAGTTFLFADLTIDEARAGQSLFEGLNLFNPNSPPFCEHEDHQHDAEVTLRFHFEDGSTIDEQFLIEAGRRLELALDEIPGGVDAQIGGEGPRALQVRSDIPIVPQLRHADTAPPEGLASGSFSTAGAAIGELVRIDIPEDPPAFTTILLDWETDASGTALHAGTIIDDEYEALGITVSADNANPNRPDLAIIFDSANPTGGDSDLQTPGDGPGNDRALDNVLIIAERGTDADGDGVIDEEPDDEGSRPAGSVEFLFDFFASDASILVLDTEESGGTIDLLDEAGEIIATLEIPVMGDNGAVVVSASDILFAGMRVNLAGSGAIGEVELNVPTCQPQLV